MIMINDPELIDDQVKKAAKTDKEHDRSIQSEKMHWTFSEFGDE